ncbi:MAG TPA: GntR family transcriptional regulator [Casimicrobiaceae bacterium]|jgi:GntR family transcriptional regulator|nr:GntR family transcriptional regulator [Casimicrobiaceae bacterium]
MHKPPTSADDTLFGNSPVPRYAQLSALFRRRIQRGEWAPGAQLPTLERLTAEFGVARVTVRQAIGLLAQEGLVSAQRGRGTFVTAHPERPGGLKLATSLASLADMYRDDEPKLTLIEETAASPTLRAEDGKPARRYHYMRRVHTRDGVAYCVIAIYLDERVFRMAPQRFRRRTVIPVLLDLPGVVISRAWQTLAIGTADFEVARLIGMPVNAPVAEVRRVCRDAEGVVIYLGEVTYRGDYIHLEMDLNP